MAIHEACLILATLLCSLVAGFLFAFSVVAMPGIGRLSDKEFLRAFQAMDRVIQDNQPLFMLVWLGSVLALIASALLGFGQVEGLDRLLLMGATLVYLLGVQASTIGINIPLNNRLQALDAEAADEAELSAARAAFEGRWNRWNRSRTAWACLSSAMLIVLVYRM